VVTDGGGIVYIVGTHFKYLPLRTCDQFSCFRVTFQRFLSALNIRFDCLALALDVAPVRFVAHYLSEMTPLPETSVPD
jgi:hypothetical protein